MEPKLSEIGALIRRSDPDRFFTSLFAPPERREALWTLYAFNNELARAREVASLPMLALIRLQWWREVVEGADRRHEVATPLRALIGQGMLLPEELEAMIAAREAEVEEETDWRAYVEGSAGALAVAAGRLLGGEGAVLERLRNLGAAYGVAGQLRRGVVPVEVLVEAGEAYLRAGRGRLPREVLAAGLVGVLARRDLRRAGPPLRGVGDRMAVLMAATLGRIG